MQAETWVYCPNCNQKTRLKVRVDTIIEHLPLFCPKCKHETLINVENNKITVITEPDAQTQSQ